MQLVDIDGKRSHSTEPIASTWRPVDLVCELDGAEVLVRTKLVRDPLTAAVCLSEAISHRVFDCVGVRTADGFAVRIRADLAAGLSAQHGFDPGVSAGRHWGTRLVSEAAPTRIDKDDHGLLADPQSLFLIYLVDVVLANRDRQTFGNVLLVPERGGQRMGVIPIDQSDCFGGARAFTEGLTSMRDRSHAEPFAGMDSIVMTGGSALVDAAISRILSVRDRILDSVSVPPDEWYGRAGVDPDAVRSFLAYRLDRLRLLGRVDHWRGMATLMGGNYALIG